MPDTREAEPRGLAFDVQGHSVHDGPGTRTTVFMAGCPLRCVWCCNPEGLFRRPVIMYREAKCKGCHRCVELCPRRAITVDARGKLERDRELCDACDSFECMEGCYYEALAVSGRYFTVSELLHKLGRDRPFWGSKGGVTLSGGEPLLQREFVRPLLAGCKERYIHTCVETTAHVPPGDFAELMRHVDWAFVDVKHMDPERHRACTGVENRVILGNLEQLAASDWPGVLVVRIPVVPGYNDSDENILATARFVRSIGLDAINILPFHRLGESKYRQLGRTYAFAEQVASTEAQLEHPKALIEAEGLLCWIGYETPF